MLYGQKQSQQREIFFLGISQTPASTQYFYRTQVNSVGNILMVEESDSEVDYFYLSYLTGTKQEMASKDRFGRGMKGGKCPPPFFNSGSAGLNCAFNNTTTFL